MKFEKNSSGLIALLASVLGIIVLYLWQPISDLFITGTYDEIVTLRTDFEILNQQRKIPLLVIHTKITNRGNVPVKINPSLDENKIEIFEVQESKSFEWIKESDDKFVTSKKIFNEEEVEIQVDPNSYLERLSAIRLPRNLYSINTTVVGKSGFRLNEKELVEISKPESTKVNVKE